MTIEIRPAEIVGAKIGDRVSYTIGRYSGAARIYGTIIGVSNEYPGHLTVEREGDGEVRHVLPSRVTVVPRKYAVGDEVGENDFPRLPSGALLLGGGLLPTYKMGNTWFAIDTNDRLTQAGVRRVRMYDRKRTIAWLPHSYTENN